MVWAGRKRIFSASSKYDSDEYLMSKNNIFQNCSKLGNWMYFG